MGLHMMKRETLLTAEGQQSTHLILDIDLCLGRSHRQIAAAEALQVGKAGMSANGYIVFLAEPCCLFHDDGIAGMIAAGHIGGSNIGHERGVHTDGIRAEALTQIAVQIYSCHDLFLLTFYLPKIHSPLGKGDRRRRWMR